jgi:acyl carrier protein
MSALQAPAGKAPTAGAIESWLVAELARVARLAPQRVNTQQMFAHYGLDSLQTAQLSGELQEWLGRELPPSLLYDFPTIEALVRHLTADTAQRGRVF